MLGFVEMTDPSSPASPPLDFEVEVDGVPFSALIKMAQTFNQLAAEVASEVVGAKNAVRWVVAGIAEGSVDFKLRPERVGRHVSQHAADQVPAILVEGITALDASPTQPEFFNLRALELARSIADMVGKDIPRVTVRHGPRSVSLSRRVAVNVARVLLGDEAPYREFGTVEGRLEALNVHADRVFVIWDPMTGERITCQFGYRIPSQRVGAAAEKRVTVSGEIHYDLDGGIDHVVAYDLDTMPEESELPTAESVLGILADA